MPRRRIGIALLCLALAFAALPRGARAEDPAMADMLAERARQRFVEGAFGAADEAVRAGIELSGAGNFNDLALLQALIAQRMGGDGRALLGAAIGAHDYGAWPRPIVDYLLGNLRLQAAADLISRSGLAPAEQQSRICLLSFYAGAFAADDGKKRLAAQLFKKAYGICTPADPAYAMLESEAARLLARQ